MGVIVQACTRINAKGGKKCFKTAQNVILLGSTSHAFGANFHSCREGVSETKCAGSLRTYSSIWLIENIGCKDILDKSWHGRESGYFWGVEDDVHEESERGLDHNQIIVPRDTCALTIDFICFSDTEAMCWTSASVRPEARIFAGSR
jgi:hypothetical protein